MIPHDVLWIDKRAKGFYPSQMTSIADMTPAELLEALMEARNRIVFLEAQEARFHQLLRDSLACLAQFGRPN